MDIHPYGSLLAAFRSSSAALGMIRLRLTLPLEGVYHPLWAATLSKRASQGWMSPVSTVTFTRWWLRLLSLAT